MLFSRSLFRFVFMSCLALWSATPTHAQDSKPALRDEVGPISESDFVMIGGIEQWITIKGESRDNPVILFVHGGPGNPMSPWSGSVYGDWEDDFTIVQWDQRYAGKTYERNEPVVELTMERFNETSLTVDRLVQDGIEVSEYLLRQLGKEKIILTGGSWGSVLGVHMAGARPDLFYAYVGVSQLVNFEENSATSYQLVLERAREMDDAEAVALLESLGPPPWEDPRNFGRLRRVVKRYEQEVTSAYPEVVSEPEYDTDDYRAAYTAGEDLSFLKFVGLRNDGMASTIDLPEFGSNFEIPVFLIQGAEDLLTVAAVSGSYFDSIAAPAKSYTLVPEAGHDPNIAMIQAHLEVLKEQVVPFIERR